MVMTTRQILRVAYAVVALAVLAWLGIGAAIWSLWREHQETVKASAAGAPTTVAAPVPAPGDAFDRARSSVQYAAPDSSGDGLPDWLLREVELPSGEKSLGSWVAILRSTGVAVCWRIAPRNAGAADGTFALASERASVRDVLDELCRCEPRYRWEWMKNSEVVNLLADEGLDVPLGDVSFRRKRIYYCLSDLATTIEPYEQIGVGQPRSYRNLFYWPVTIQAKHITVRDYLNLAVNQYDGMTWTVDASGGLTLEAPKATEDAVVEQYRSEAADYQP
jgi:hypothetical protein